MQYLRTLIQDLAGAGITLEAYGRSGRIELELEGEEFGRRVGAYRGELARWGQAGVRAAALMFKPEETIEFFVAAVAAMYEKIVIVPLYPNWPAATQKEYLEAYGLQDVIVGKGFASRVEAWRESLGGRLLVVDLQAGAAEGGARLQAPPPLEYTADRSCAWIFTSGTSGKLAKLTDITFGNIDAAVENIQKLRFLRPGMVVHCPLSVSHVFAFACVMGFLSLKPKRALFSDVQYMGRLPEERTGRIDGMILVPIVLQKMRATFYERLTQRLGGRKAPPELQRIARVPLTVRKALKKIALRAEQGVIDLETTGRCGIAGRLAAGITRRLFGRAFSRRLGSPGFVVVGGARPDLRVMAFLEVMGTRCLQGWGMTETTGPLCVCDLDDRRRGAFGTCGIPFDGTRLYVQDGELVAEGDQVARGYLEPGGRLTPFNGAKRTGDRAEFDTAGRLKILGKASDRITTTNGLNHDPAVLEEWLLARDTEQENLLDCVAVIGDGQPGLAGVFFLREQGGAEAYVERLVREYNESHDLPERIGTWAVHPESLRQSGFMGPTAKLRRRRVEDAYASLFA